MGEPQPLSYLEALANVQLSGVPAGSGLGGGPIVDALVGVDKVAVVTDIMGAFPRFDAWGPYLDVVGTGATAIDQYNKSTAQTEAGKFVDGVLAGAMDYAIGKSNPLLAAVDSGLGAFAETVFGVKGVSIGDTENTAIRATVTLVEGVITWDEKGMEDFHTKSLNGEYGPIFQAASEFGEWAKPVTSEIVEFFVEDVFGGISIHDMEPLAVPEIQLGSSSEETSMRSSSVAYETVPPPRPPETPSENHPERGRR
jgi:hypothetical protein